jgi:diguanylate cyclase (GGDEF)-like protein
VTAPLAAIALAIVLPLAVARPASVHQAPLMLLFFGLFVAAEITVLSFTLHRHAVSASLIEIPLLLALFFLPPSIVVVTRLASVALVLGWRRFPIVKLCFNLASTGAGTAVAALIVVSAGQPVASSPESWAVLAVSVWVTALISLVAVILVITIVQGWIGLPALIRNAAPALAMVAVNIAVGLVVLLVLQATRWSVVLLLLLAVVLVQVYRSYATFARQHRSLTELYDLTRAIGESGRDGGLPDVLLGRVREMMGAEYATLWLPAQGRHPEVLLTARVDDRGLLDMTATPDTLRRRAVTDGKTIAAGPRLGDESLRTALRQHGAKDAIVVPLRSGGAVIGSLEVANRLGDLTYFSMDEVRLLETLSAHASVAVENSRLVERLRFDAYHDALTGLPNRRRLLASLEEAVKVRAPGEVVAVFLFDVDGLRDVNDSLGYSAGDQLVSEVGRRLRSLAPAAALVGRAGGDEFAVTMRLSTIDSALGLAMDLRRALQQPMELSSIELDVDAAVGVAVHPDHGTDPEILLQRADLATHAAKQLSVPVQMFHPSLESRSAHRLGLAADLRRAIELGEIEVFFQPKVTLVGRRVIGVECLARWEHPAHGTVAPVEFVAVAEHTGQLGRLTEVVLREALRRCRGWLDEGRPLPVAVNISPRTLVDMSFPTQVAALLEEYLVPASLLTLEITEDGMVGETDRPLPALRKLNEMGVRLAVDDFGTGYSSLSYLRSLPVHEVKIDRSFVQGMATDPGDLAIVRAVVDLSRHFGLTAVAEGVESELTLSLLEEVGCDVGQGFLFSRPLPFERFEAWLGAQTEPEPQPVAPAQPGEVSGEIRRLRAVR